MIEEAVKALAKSKKYGGQDHSTSLLAIIVGGIIVAAVAHVSILASGGYTEPGAPLQIAVALGLLVGAYA